jgi:hypothetical protein
MFNHAQRLVQASYTGYSSIILCLQTHMRDSSLALNHDQIDSDVAKGNRADGRAGTKVIKSYLPSIGGVFGKLWQSRNALAFPFPPSKAFLLLCTFQPRPRPLSFSISYLLPSLDTQYY